MRRFLTFLDGESEDFEFESNGSLAPSSLTQLVRCESAGGARDSIKPGA